MNRVNTHVLYMKLTESKYHASPWKKLFSLILYLYERWWTLLWSLPDVYISQIITTFTLIVPYVNYLSIKTTRSISARSKRLNMYSEPCACRKSLNLIFGAYSTVCVVWHRVRRHSEMRESGFISLAAVDFFCQHFLLLKYWSR